MSLIHIPPLHLDTIWLHNKLVHQTAVKNDLQMFFIKLVKNLKIGAPNCVICKYLRKLLLSQLLDGTATQKI